MGHLGSLERFGKSSFNFPCPDFLTPRPPLWTQESFSEVIMSKNYKKGPQNLQKGSHFKSETPSLSSPDFFRGKSNEDFPHLLGWKRWRVTRTDLRERPGERSRRVSGPPWGPRPSQSRPWRRRGERGRGRARLHRRGTGWSPTRWSRGRLPGLRSTEIRNTC